MKNEPEEIADNDVQEQQAFQDPTPSPSKHYDQEREEIMNFFKKVSASQSDYEIVQREMEKEQITDVFSRLYGHS